ncbi:serine/threonine-protein kinase [Sandaracinus amylolyticus]|uniref:serine/threonine-protein kinase n=1 Tax=Sandaracinus amylolyticus TaxID=927083 RepID=UPI001F0AF5F6|nr:serine/threonine-protein kinase [Sandaracinus amylolyticus]
MADPNLGREIANQFRILEKIGSGGMGAVYKAEQPDMRRFVAIKILHPRYLSRPDLVSRFRREARAMSHLAHPNTAKVFLYGQLEDGACYFAMEYLEGRNLAQTVRAEGPMDAARAIHIMVQVCGALEEAHSKGIVHRDLKPENIFLTNLGGIADFPKVLDFGLAKVTEREMRPGSLILTQEGMVFGTPEFMSPEQARGEKLDGRSDIYSLGVILYELLTGKLPFDAAQPMEFIQKHIKEPPLPLQRRAPNREFPAGLWEAIAKALAKDPAQRFQTANELANALKDVLARPRSAPAPSPEPVYGGYGSAGGGGMTGGGPAGYQATQMGFNPSPYPAPQPAQVPAPSAPPPAQSQSAYPQQAYPQQAHPQSAYPQQAHPGHPAHQASYAQHSPPHQAATVHAPTGGHPPASRAPWIVLGLGTLLALLGTVALVLAIWLR